MGQIKGREIKKIKNIPLWKTFYVESPTFHTLY